MTSLFRRVCHQTPAFRSTRRELRAPEAFRLLSGKEALAKYLFNTKRNEHYFCKHCGVRSYGIGNAPAVTIHL